MSDGSEFSDIDEIEYNEFQKRLKDTKSGKPSESNALKRKLARTIPDVDDIYGNDQHAGMLGPQKRRSKGKVRKASELPPEVSVMMGKANMLFTSAKYEEAIQLLNEVVRLAPNAPDPYHTLGLAHEQLGHTVQALEFYLYAAHAQPKNAQIWKQVAEMSRAQDLPDQAIYCLDNVLKLNPSDQAALYERSQLHMEMSHTKRAIDGFTQILTLNPGDVSLVKQLAKLHLEAKQGEKAIAVVEPLTLKLLEENKPDLDLVNILSELYLAEHQHAKTTDMLTKLQAQLGQSMPLDLTVKFGLAQCYGGDVSAAERVFDQLLASDVSVFGDLYWDVADAYLSLNMSDAALRFLTPLLQLPSFDTPALWLKLARAHRAKKRFAIALKYFEDVRVEVPDNVEASLALSELYAQMGRPQDALAVMNTLSSATGVSSSDSSLPTITGNSSKALSLAALREQIEVPLQTGLVMFSLEQHQSFLDTCLGIVEKAASPHVRSKASSFRRRLDSVLRTASDDEADDDENDEGEADDVEESQALVVVDGQQAEGASTKQKKQPALGARIVSIIGEASFFELLMKVCHSLAYFNRYTEAGQLVHNLLRCKIITSPQHVSTLRFLAVTLAYNNTDYVSASEAVRTVCQQMPHSNTLWNLFNKVCCKAQMLASTSIHRFLLRLFEKSPESYPLLVLVANQCLMAGRFRVAIALYCRALRTNKDPLLYLCASVAYLCECMSRKCTARNEFVMRAFALLHEYSKTRCQEYAQEVQYNLGRGYHQLGMYHLAIPHYEECLRTAAATIDCDGESDLDLRREAAYNLSLIYAASGNTVLARQLLRDHVTI